VTIARIGFEQLWPNCNKVRKDGEPESGKAGGCRKDVNAACGKSIEETGDKTHGYIGSSFRLAVAGPAPDTLSE
jgi:hypothetical protein